MAFIPLERDRLSLPSFHPSQLWICEKAGRNQRVAGRLYQFEKAKGEVNVLEAVHGDISE